MMLLDQLKTLPNMTNIQNVMKMVRTVPDAEQVAAQTIQETRGE